MVPTVTARVRLLAALLLLPIGVLAAQRPAAPPTHAAAEGALSAEPGSELTIHLLTFGVGKEIWEKFGHNAILIHDARTGTDSVYHWGLFDFRQPNFIGRFLQGRMLYSMGGFSLEQTMADYYRLDRSVWAQELALTPAQRLQIRQFISWNQQPRNRDYLYDYFTDNCSTRVRDILDRALGGAIRTGASRMYTGRSYRWHAVRLTQDDPPIATGIDVGLGRPADRELTTWDEMFLPRTVHDYVARLRVRAPDGSRHPLVRAERTLYTSTQFTAPESPPTWWPVYLAVGIAVGALLFWSGTVALRRQDARGVRIGAAVMMSLVAFVLGLVGMLLMLLWAATNHRFAHQNENLFLYNPLWLLLAIAGPLAIARGRATWARELAYVLAASGVIGLLLHLAGLSRQANLPMFALALPPALAFAWVMHRTRSGAAARTSGGELPSAPPTSARGTARV